MKPSGSPGNASEKNTREVLPSRRRGINRALTNPSATFKRPQEVVESNDLSREQKIEALRRWEYDARELQVADEEGMAPAEPQPVILDAILNALRSLGAPADVEHSAPTKQGGK
jgi:hypothetical protein